MHLGVCPGTGQEVCTRVRAPMPALMAAPAAAASWDSGCVVRWKFVTVTGLRNTERRLPVTGTWLLLGVSS